MSDTCEFCDVLLPCEVHNISKPKSPDGEHHCYTASQWHGQVEALVTEVERLKAERDEVLAENAKLKDVIEWSSYQQSESGLSVIAQLHSEAKHFRTLLDSERTRREEGEKALRAVLEWRNGPEGPEIMFEHGTKMLRLVRKALTAAACEMPCGHTSNQHGRMARGEMAGACDYYVGSPRYAIDPEKPTTALEDER